MEHEQQSPLTKEAQKWATKVAKDNRVIRTCTRQIHHLQEQIAAGTAKVSTFVFDLTFLFKKIWLSVK